MITEYAWYYVPSPYSTGMQCPEGTCTYRDESSYFVFYESGRLYSADMLRGRADNAGMDKIIYHDGQWIVERQHVSESDCSAEILVSKKWRESRNFYVRDVSMRRNTMQTIFRGFRTSPMADVVIETIKKSLESQGYDDLFWDHIQRTKHEPLLVSIEYCDSYRQRLSEARKGW